MQRRLMFLITAVQLVRSMTDLRSRSLEASAPGRVASLVTVALGRIVAGDPKTALATDEIMPFGKSPLMTMVMPLA